MVAVGGYSVSVVFGFLNDKKEESTVIVFFGDEANL